MQKSLDSIMSNSLKAAFGKSKAANENKTSTGAEAPTGASNPFSNLLERMIQKNQPKVKTTETHPSNKPLKKADKQQALQDKATSADSENQQSSIKANQPQANQAEQAIQTQQPPAAQALDEAPPSTEQALWTDNLNNPPAEDVTLASNDASPEIDFATDTTDSTQTNTDITTDINLLLSLQQPLTLGLYQPPVVNPADVTITEATTIIDTNISTTDLPASNSSPTLPQLAPLSETASFSLSMLQPTSTPKATDLSSNLPNADTLPVSQSSEVPSQGLADILDNGQAALPGTAFGPGELTMQASTMAGAIEISQTVTLSNAPISLEALSGELEIPKITGSLTDASNVTLPNPGNEMGIGTTTAEGTGTSSNISLTQTTAATSLAPTPLELPFGSLLEQAEAGLQQDNMSLDTSANDGPIELEILETEIPSTEANVLSELSQVSVAQTMNGSSSTSTTSSETIAQFSSAAQTPADQVAEGTIYSIKQGQRELIIRLNPDNLGEVRINLVRHGDNSLSARLIASTQESHDLLQSQLESLKESLESQGIQVERLNVMLAGSPETQNQNTQSQQHNNQQSTDNNNNTQQQANNQGQADHNTFAQQMANHSQHKHGTNQGHQAAFQQQGNATSGLSTDGAGKPETQPQHHANGNISILV